jgi:hypothetical protein
MNKQIVKIVFMGTVLMTATASAADATPLLTIPSAAPNRFVSAYQIDLQPVSIDTPHP